MAQKPLCCTGISRNLSSECPKKNQFPRKFQRYREKGEKSQKYNN